MTERHTTPPLCFVSVFVERKQLEFVCSEDSSANLKNISTIYIVRQKVDEFEHITNGLSVALIRW